MATNQKYDKADSFSCPVPDGTAANTPVVVGALPGTTRNLEGTGGNADNFATVDFVGAYEFSVVGALKIGTAVYAVGTADGNGVIVASSMTATVGSNTLWGYSLTVKGAGTAAAIVRPARV